MALLIPRSSGLQRAGWCSACLAALVVAASLAAPAQAQERLSEDEVKAAFLYNFMKFVEWPAADPRPRPFVICLAGSGDVGDALAAILKAAGERGREFAVRPLRDGDDPRACHSVFIAASEARRTADILGRIGNWATLTVGETPSFLHEGGLVRFYVSENRLRFQIDSVGARAAGLKVSAQLLSLSR